MRLTTEQDNGIDVLSVDAPRIDSACAEALRDAARAEMAHGDLWLIDLSKVDFMDSSGIGTMVGLLKWMGHDRRMELCGLNPPVLQVFKLTRLDTVFTIHADVAAGHAAHQHGVAKAGR